MKLSERFELLPLADKVYEKPLWRWAFVVVIGQIVLAVLTHLVMLLITGKESSSMGTVASMVSASTYAMLVEMRKPGYLTKQVKRWLIQHVLLIEGVVAVPVLYFIFVIQNEGDLGYAWFIGVTIFAYLIGWLILNFGFNMGVRTAVKSREKQAQKTSNENL